MQFWFLRKNIKDKEPLVYDGNITNLGKCLVYEESRGYWWQYPDGFKLTKFNITVYWKPYTFLMPSPPIWGWSIGKDVTQEFIEYVTSKSHDWYYSDTELWIWIAIAKENKPMLVNLEWFSNPIFVFVNKRLYEIQDTLGRDPELISKFVWWDTELDIETKIWLLSMKEFMMWFIRIDPFEYMHMNKKIDIHIGETYNFNMMWEQIRVPHNYTIALRKAMFSWLRDPWQQLMRSFQYETILRECRQTYECTLRRQGKTVWLAYRAERWMMRQWFEAKHNLRPSSVLYLSLQQGTNEQVKEYMNETQNSMMRQEWWRPIKMFKYDSKTNVVRWGNQDKTYWKCTFLSEQGHSPGVWLAGDLLIIDESFLIKDEIKSKLDPIVDIEWADYFSSSTMYKDSLKNFAWREMIIFEQNLKHYNDIDNVIYNEFKKFKHLADKEVRDDDDKREYASLVVNTKETTFDRISLRYDIDKLDHLSEPYKDKIKYRYLHEQQDPLRYYTELYCRFPEEDVSFKIEWCKKDPTEMEDLVFEEIVSALDPAMDQDQSWFIQLWREPHSAKIYVFNAKYIRRTWLYVDQVNEIKWELEISNRRHKLAEIPNEITNWFGIDWTGQQKAIVEIFESNWLMCHWKFSWKWWVSEETIKNWRTKISKSAMVWILQACFENNWIVIDASLKDLIKEIKNYKQVWSTWQAISWTDDLVSALLMAVYILYNKLSKKWALSDSYSRVDPEFLTQEQLIAYNKEKHLKAQQELELKNQLDTMATYFESHIR